jgi:hypothetical protein
MGKQPQLESYEVEEGQKGGFHVLAEMGKFATAISLFFSHSSSQFPHKSILTCHIYQILMLFYAYNHR